ncbi:MAG: ATP-binding cassette domain-containing protein [Haliscomenobacter sp.]|uniref:peptidase domain-containing ABC transporter n=1 Tax=Haliscomenobacter sp. TaxID=2717303 RepID=UPI0029A1BBA6|nr:ATP-binding cassette domain-containing protein [Haliscomenobacter sp.]MDX2069980.1 ATP-binding cassette domain-containing protein [Haliscomenobacter sp.]
MAGNSNIHPLRRFFQLLRLDRKDITYIYLNSIFAGLIGLILPLGVQAIIGLISGGDFSASLWLLIGVVTIGTALTGIIKIMQITITETLQRRVFVRSSFDFSYRLPRLKLDSLTRFYPPELVNRFFDTLNLQKGLPKILIDFSEAILNIAFGVILMAFYHSFFAFFGVFLALLLFLVYRFTGPRGLSTSLSESKYKYEVVYWLEEMARSLSTFKMAGYTPYPLRRTDGLVSKYLDNRAEHFKVLKFQYGVIVGFKVLITFALLALGSYLVINNQMTIGQFVAAEIVVILVIGNVEKLILTMEVIYDVLTALDKLGFLTDLPIEKSDGLRFDQIDRDKPMHLQVENLNFRFEDSDRTTLNDVSLEIKPGERVCIAGSQSSGKSTLLQLIAGIYADFEGSIAYNGFPLKSLDLCSLRGNIGDYIHEANIFTGTILENITLGNPDTPLEAIVDLAEELGIASYIRNLPNGYNTILLPEGRNIPRTIRTKLILLRAIVTKPKLLLAEDFFKSLESKDRDFIANFITRRDAPWTLVAVSSDPVLAAQCDRLLLMENGQIIAEGTWQTLQDHPVFNAVFRSKEIELLG